MESREGLFQARRVIVGQGEGPFFRVFLGAARFPFAQGLFEGLDVAVIGVLHGLARGFQLGQFRPQAGGVVCILRRRVVTDEADDAERKGNLGGCLEGAGQAQGCIGVFKGNGVADFDAAPHFVIADARRPRVLFDGDDGDLFRAAAVAALQLVDGFAIGEGTLRQFAETIAPTRAVREFDFAVRNHFLPELGRRHGTPGQTELVAVGQERLVTAAGKAEGRVDIDELVDFHGKVPL